MKRVIRGLVSITLATLLIVVFSVADVIPTPEWIIVKGDITYNGQPAPLGTLVDAFDPTGVHCGRIAVGDVTDSVGIYGFMNVYRDDITTPSVDEGAEPGDSISLQIMGRDATIESGEVVYWTSNGDPFTSNIAGTGTIGLNIVDPADDTLVVSGATIRFFADIQNTGNGIDFYGVSSNSARGWTTVDYDTTLYPGTDSAEYVWIYNDPGLQATVFFDVEIPISPGDLSDTVIYEVFSRLDTTVRETDTVILLNPSVDIADGHGEQFPIGFTISQNYPNPFNPATSIAFELPVKTSVLLEVYNVLGQRVDAVDLGTRSAGSHTYEYDASSLASGVYLYRLVTDLGERSRKMILAK